MKLSTLLSETLPGFGHRNWVVVADSAYPEQSRPGIRTVALMDDQSHAVDLVIRAIENAPHVRPIFHLDAELSFLTEQDAPGITAYRDWLNSRLRDYPVKVSAHEDIIAKLDAAAALFNVLIVKSNMVLPYTSVFVELECGYWGAEQEQRLRAAISAGKDS